MLDKKIQAIENGLLPEIYIKGIPQSPMKLKDRMERYHVPGVSIAVINDASVEWARGYGIQEKYRNTHVSTDTLFQAASISKPISAMAALKLVEQGELDLDTDVNEMLSSWHVPENEHTQEHKVTLRGILAHTAGLTVRGFQGYSSNDEVPSLHQIFDGEPPANSKPIRADIVPGSESRYSGGGYTVMQQLLEDVSGKSFQEIMQTTVLDKLGMHDSMFEQPLPNQYRERVATAHSGKGKPIEGKWHTYPEKAAAGLWTTPTDLAKFAIEIMESSQTQSSKILSSSMINEMLIPVKDDYGLGLRIKKFGDIVRFGHGGSNEGFRCYLVAYKGTGQGAVVMTNGDNGGLLVMEIVRSIANAYGWSDFLPLEKSLFEYLLKFIQNLKPSI